MLEEKNVSANEYARHIYTDKLWVKHCTICPELNYIVIKNNVAV